MKFNVDFRWGLAVLPLLLMMCALPPLGTPAGPVNPPTPTPIDLNWLFTPQKNGSAIGGGADSLPAATVPPGEATPQIVSPPTISMDAPPLLYYTQAGDTLSAVIVRFGVLAQEITSPDPLPGEGLLPPGQLLIIPNRLTATGDDTHLLPDSEFVNGPSSVDFDVQAYVAQAGGYLSTYREWLQSTGWTSGADIVARVATENSINPRLLLALLEYRAGWVLGEPQTQAQRDYPLGYQNEHSADLYHQLVWAVNQLSIGYYGWREGRLTAITFDDGHIVHLAPTLNAGTAALQFFFAVDGQRAAWQANLDPKTGFIATHERMFGDLQLRARQVEPLYPHNLEQPPLILPFLRNQLWALTGGPHGAWEHDGAWAAIDFAPGSVETGCAETINWVTAAAPGLVVRSERGVVVIDLDGDGYEQTGWTLLYLHIAEKGRVPLGVHVEAGDKIGQPSCEGGQATGTHVHFARKYNGEWIAADGPVPFVLDGWRVHAGQAAYEGYMTRGDQYVLASPLGTFDTRIVRTQDDP
ncbi:MAG: hypothetical protein Fur0018_17140 [Anaerolineales bacterium]